MDFSFGTSHLKRYADIAQLLVKYGRGDLLRTSEHEDLTPPGEEGGTGRAEDLARDLEKLGPTFIKLGQMLSTRADLLPPEYLEALARLQDDVKPFDGEQAATIVEDELKVRLSKGFSRFDKEPLAAASLGQVHYAELRDGRPVAVKVQRPEVSEQVADDLQSLLKVARMLDRRSDIGARYDLEGIVGEFEKSLAEELDYRREADNLLLLGNALSRFDRLMVPRPIEGYVTRRVLTMEHVEGRKLSALSPLARTEMNIPELAEQLFEAYLHQILVEGFFHADPHPGNLFLTRDGRVALLDLGMVGRTTPRTQENLISLLLAVSEGQGDRAAELAISMAEVSPTADRHAFERAVASVVTTHQNATVERMAVGRVMVDMTSAAGRHGVRLPAELTLLGKTLLNLDQVARILDPEFDPNAAVRKHSGDILRRRMQKQSSPGQVFARLLEVNQVVQRLPSQLSRTLERVASNELELRIRVLDESRLLEGFQKVANRIATGLVLAALIVGAAMLMSVNTDFILFGYPGLAIVLFLVAVAGGVALLIDILRHDRRATKSHSAHLPGPSN